LNLHTVRAAHLRCVSHRASDPDYGTRPLNLDAAGMPESMPRIARPSDYNRAFLTRAAQVN
jgi:hypothetical protein